MNFVHAELFGFAKADTATTEAATRLQRLLAQQESAVQRAFTTFVRDSTSPAVMDEVSDLLERGDVDGALAIIDTHIDSFGAILPQLFQDAAVAETAAITGQLAAHVGIAFDPTNPAAAAVMRANKLEFVTAMTDSQKVATRQALANALDTGRGLAGAARDFRDSIGLAQNQVQAVANYRRLLQANSSEALDRVLRDRRFDPSVERAIETGEPLSPEKIDTMVERYRMRQLAHRAETIARTESVKNLSEAQEAAFSQTMQRAKIDPERVTQHWHSTEDERTRDSHRPMNGQVRPYGTPFTSGAGVSLRYPGDPKAPAKEVIKCRCKRSFRIDLGRRLAA